MVTKKKNTREQEAKKGRVKVGKLKLNKETVKDLTGSEEKQIKGGALPKTGPACTGALGCHGTNKTVLC